MTGKTIQIIPANNVKAIFAGENDELLKERVICFALSDDDVISPMIWSDDEKEVQGVVEVGNFLGLEFENSTKSWKVELENYKKKKHNY